MADKIYTYRALRVHQGTGSPALVLLSASAMEIDRWVGIPQKTRIVDGETLGFQRDDNPVRVDQIAQFYANPQNVIHNPLLCAIRRKVGDDVTFTPDAPVVEGDAVQTFAESGVLTVTSRVRDDEPLADLFREAREALEQRVPELRGRPDPDELIAKLRVQADDPQLFGDFYGEDEAGDGASGDIDTAFADEADQPLQAEDALFEESHVSEFWSELRAREILLTRLGSQFTGDEFVGFSRADIESYLKPIVLVDGQHRLLGALKAARDAVDQTVQSRDFERVGELMKGNVPPEEINDILLLEEARRLPISLLLDEKPQEHVFQFVVVNQKATPVRPALLATIISTSLSEDELEPITDRLESAGVPLKSSRAISYFTKNAESPFMGLVARGLANEGSDLLSWTVLGQLVSVFRELKGGRFFHDGKIDYADSWKRRYLAGSAIIPGQYDGWEGAFEAWRHPDGPWRDVFVEFWSAVRDILGSQVNPDAHNYWGSPRNSNLFNKPSLMTLAADFFAYLVETRKGIASRADVRPLVEDWLFEVDKNYFARDWKTEGVKKDSVGSRKQWSKIWYVYRRDPRSLPRVSLFSELYKAG